MDKRKAPLLEVEQLSVDYNGKTVLQDVNFTLMPGQVLGIVGESGSGKSTILKTILGLLGDDGIVTGGKIQYQSENLLQCTDKQLRQIRGQEIGMVFQDCKSALCPIRTIGSQMVEGMSAHGRKSKQQVYETAGALLKKVGLQEPERILKSYPFQLSGGMNQRVGICMALLKQPKLLLADEPTSALDVSVQAQVVRQLHQMQKETGAAMVLVTHNMHVVEALADQILVLKQGCVMEYRDADKVLKNPQSAYTKALLDAVYHLRRKQDAE